MSRANQVADYCVPHLMKERLRTSSLPGSSNASGEMPEITNLFVSTVQWGSSESLEKVSRYSTAV